MFQTGYRLAEANGGVYSCGDAAFYGSLATLGITPNRPIVGMASTPMARGIGWSLATAAFLPSGMLLSTGPWAGSFE